MLKRCFRRPQLPAGLTPVTADCECILLFCLRYSQLALVVLHRPDVATVLFTSNLIGILFARSLHYQFYSWYAQQIPFLAWRTRYPVFMKCAPFFTRVHESRLTFNRLLIMLGIEYAWNVFPATRFSSGVLLAANTALLAGIWLGYSEGKTRQKVS